MLTVISYNIRHCLGRNMRLDVGRIADVIQSAKPDIVCLQEVYEFGGTSSRYRQATKLRELLNMNSVFDAAVRVGPFMAGNMVFARDPLKKLTPLKLPYFGEPRLCQRTSVITKHGKLTVLNAHLGLLSLERKKQLSAMSDNISDDSPTIVCGDFNTRPKTISSYFPCHRIINTDLCTYPSNKPKYILDNILVSPDYKLLDVKTVNTQASDHLPVIATLVKK